MKTDRELLELAAKAAGIEGSQCDWKTALKVTRDRGVSPVLWNPLTDDGDALRLAVKLRINVCHWDGPLRISAEHPEIQENSIMQETDGGPMWATRRVIVRAAAAIGENMA